MKCYNLSLQIYSKYAEVSDELIKEKEAKQLVQNELNYLIQVRKDTAG